MLDILWGFAVIGAFCLAVSEVAVQMAAREGHLGLGPKNKKLLKKLWSSCSPPSAPPAEKQGSHWPGRVAADGRVARLDGWD